MGGLLHREEPLSFTNAPTITTNAPLPKRINQLTRIRLVLTHQGAKAPQEDNMATTHTTTFRHDTQTSEAIIDIINYLEKEMPGTQANASDAIRYAILAKAADIRKEPAQK